MSRFFNRTTEPVEAAPESIYTGGPFFNSAQRPERPAPESLPPRLDADASTRKASKAAEKSPEMLAPAADESATRRCGRCHVWKSLSEFGRASRAAGGYWHSRCNPCRLAETQEWRARHHDELLARRRAARAAAKAARDE